jgi:GNAT superfamily N-acetyltransferase
MADHIRILQLGQKQIGEAAAMVSSVFDAFVAPGLSNEGIAEFKSFIEPERLKGRLNADSFILAAEIDDEMVGIIGVRDWDHIFLLFVKGEHQGRGIASSLLAEALKMCKRSNPNLEVMTVNSSPNAVEAYRRMGFVQTDEEQLENGIRFVPMVLDVTDASGLSDEDM